MSQWNNIIGTGEGLWQSAMNNPPQYPGQAVAPPTDLMTGYWNQAAGGAPTPDYSGVQGSEANLYNQAGGMQVNPQTINMPQFGPGSFQPGNLPTGYAQQNVFQTASPVWVGAPGSGQGGPYGASGPAVSGLASSYYVRPDQVSAASVQAPGAIAPLSGLMQVTAPQNLQQYQMGPAQNVGAQTVTAPQIRDLQMAAAANVAPQAQVGSQSFTDPGTAASFMSPYVQQVVNAQLAQAQTQEQQQLEQQSAQAAQAGAFGGSRQAVEAANTSIGYQQLASQIQATGLQNAYQQAQQQFNTQQALGMQGQQFNVQSGLQAALANQQMQQQSNLQNLSAALQTQGLQAQTGLTSQQLNQQAGLQAAMANQQAGLTVGQQNLAALLGVQQLGSTQNMQAQMANQQQGLQAAIANQQGQEFSAGQQLQAGLSNAQMNMAAQQLNQQSNLQAGLAAQQMGLQGGEFTAGQGLQAAMANQAAAMQSLGLQYQGGLQAALAQNQMGMQGAEFGGQLGLSGAAQQAGLQQSQMGLNLSAQQAQQAAANQVMNIGQNNMANYLNNLAAQQAPAMSQQGMAQQQADTAYQQWQQNNMLPYQTTSWIAQMLGMQPLPYSTTGTTTGTTALTAPGPNLLNTIVGGIAGLAGAAGKLGLGFARGGLHRGDEPRRFQYGGFDPGLTAPHYPQPMMPAPAPIPDLLSRYRIPKQQTFADTLSTINSDLNEKDSGLAKFLGTPFKKKSATDQSTDTSSTSSTDTSSQPGGLVSAAPSESDTTSGAVTPPGQSPGLPSGANLDSNTWSYVRQGYPLDQAREMASMSGANPFYSWETPYTGWSPRPAPAMPTGIASSAPETTSDTTQPDTSGLPTDWNPDTGMFGLGSGAGYLGYAGGGLAHSDAPADRRQVLQILREKGLTKAQGGPIVMKRRHFLPRPKGGITEPQSERPFPSRKGE
jgi:hypothetical protein